LNLIFFLEKKSFIKEKNQISQKNKISRKIQIQFQFEFNFSFFEEKFSSKEKIKLAGKNTISI